MLQEVKTTPELRTTLQVKEDSQNIEVASGVDEEEMAEELDEVEEPMETTAWPLKELPSASPIDSSKLPLNEHGELDFYWLDACEVFGSPNTIYLLGKVWLPEQQSYKSCCVVVENVKRQVYVAPSATAKPAMSKVKQDFEALRREHRITRLRAKVTYFFIEAAAVSQFIQGG